MHTGGNTDAAHAGSTGNAVSSHKNKAKFNYLLFVATACTSLLH